MKIRIVASRLEADRILPRLARILSEGTGWELAEEPSEHVQLNLFLPYLELDRFKEFRATPIAAWFTHADVDVPEKMALWERSAQRCDIRFTSALIYYNMLKKYGPTYIVTPPLDHNKFVPK